MNGTGAPQSASGTTSTYTAADLCGSEAAIVAPNGFIDPGYFHRVTLTGLTPNARYDYKVGQKEFPPGELSKKFTFRAPKAAGDAATPTKFLMWADMGTDQYNTLEHFGNVNNALALTELATKMLIEDDTIGLITHPGDLSYACGDALIWDQWYRRRSTRAVLRGSLHGGRSTRVAPREGRRSFLH